jgi:hypothetical protein
MNTPKQQDKSICIPFPSEAEYHSCIQDRAMFRSHLQETYALHPELFPTQMLSGFTFHGFVHSQKQQFSLRRIKLKQNGEVYQVRPSFMMPYMIGKVDDIEKALFLLRWGVPFDALAYVFGRDAMFWYRAYVSLGRNSVVGATVKTPSHLPQHLLADEKHTRLQSEKAYIATTVARGCILGAALAENADTQALTEAYQEFQAEAHDLDPDYTPQTVNTDGWEPTQKAWKTLFPKVTLILCFLHAFLRIRDRCKRHKELLQTMGHKVWNAYNAETRPQFSQRIRRLREWAQTKLEIAPVKEKVLSLCQKAPSFRKMFEFPDAYRTSNALDRLMNYQDRLLYAMQYFHGTKESARLYARAMALVWNFHPYGTKTRRMYPNRSSPFQDINGFRYHDNWLQNMMIAASMTKRAS